MRIGYFLRVDRSCIQRMSTFPGEGTYSWPETKSVVSFMSGGAVRSSRFIQEKIDW